MTHYVYVIGGSAVEAEEFIRAQNDVDSWPRDTEFINLTRVEQLLGAKRNPTVAKVGMYWRRSDYWEWEMHLLARGAKCTHRP